MQTNSNTVVLTALLAALRPIARLLLKVGIGYREFSEIAKTAFVDVSTIDHGLRGRPTNISRVAVMTGMTRKEVKRLRDKISAGSETVVARNAPYVAILDQWHSDDRFLDDRGRPIKLRFDGPEPSFSTLVKNYGGDIPAGAMRTELKRVKAVAEDSEGNLEVLLQVFRPVDQDEKLVLALGQALVGLADTLSFNIDCELNEGRIQRHAYGKNVRLNDLPRIRRISRERVADFVESINDVFTAYSTAKIENGPGFESSRNDMNKENSNSGEQSGITVGVGAYYFELDERKSKFF